MGAKNIYLDTCCFSRLFDIKTHPKVIAEAVKIQDIIDNRIIGGYIIVGSPIITAEIRNIRNAARRKATEKRYFEIVADEVAVSAQSIARAASFNLMGLGKMDGFHLAMTEAAGARYLLTTDADFIRICAKKNLTTVKVINPIDF